MSPLLVSVGVFVIVSLGVFILASVVVRVLKASKSNDDAVRRNDLGPCRRRFSTLFGATLVMLAGIVVAQAWSSHGSPATSTAAVADERPSKSSTEPASIPPIGNRTSTTKLERAEAPVTPQSEDDNDDAHPLQASTEETFLEVIRLWGNGQQASEKFVLSRGLAIIRTAHDGDSNFIVTLLDANGRRSGCIANAIGPYVASHAEGIRKDGTYLLNISADGNWKVTIEQPRPRIASAMSTFNGRGPQATNLFTLTKGLKTFRLKHNGTSNFIAYLLNHEGKRIEVLANGIGDFNGSKAVGIKLKGIYILYVRADGPWSIAIE